MNKKRRKGCGKTKEQQILGRRLVLASVQLTPALHSNEIQMKERNLRPTQNGVGKAYQRPALASAFASSFASRAEGRWNRFGAGVRSTSAFPHLPFLYDHYHQPSTMLAEFCLGRAIPSANSVNCLGEVLSHHLYGDC